MAMDSGATIDRHLRGRHRPPLRNLRRTYVAKHRLSLEEKLSDQMSYKNTILVSRRGAFEVLRLP